MNDLLLRLTHFLSEHYDDLPVWTKVLDTLPVGVSVVSREFGQIIYINHGFNRITGVSGGIASDSPGLCRTLFPESVAETAFTGADPKITCR
ncbi:TPA: PAS domain-containing protein [Klebsiella variicola subsp. variicola]